MRILRAVSLCLVAMLASAAQAQQQWPDRQIKIVVGFPPGPLDIVGRPVAQKLQEALGQPVIFENRPGANGTIATELVMRAEPDGYTILLGTAGTHVTAVHLFKNLRYDPVKDFMPIIAAVEPFPLVPATWTMGRPRWGSPSLRISRRIRPSRRPARPPGIAWFS